MNLQKKSDIDDLCIKIRPEFNDDSEWIAGYFHDVEKIENNADFLEVYRHIQYFKLKTPDEMIKYASIPNYSLLSLIENMKLTGEDIYFETLSTMLNNHNNIYSTESLLLPKENESDIFQQLAILNRADLTQSYIKSGEVPNDIYTYSQSGNATLEIVNVLIEEGYIPSDEIIYWYIIKGMGGIAKICISDVTDTDFITDLFPIDLTGLKLIQEIKWPTDNEKDWIKNIPLEYAIDIIYNMIGLVYNVDVAMFISLYRLISSEMTQHEKLMLLTNILLKKEKFLISIFLKELVDEQFNLSILESTIFTNAGSDVGYQIFKLEIEKSSNHDIIIDYCNDINEGFKHQYYNEDESAFISRNNEKYIETSSDDDDSDNDSVPECNDDNNYIRKSFSFYDDNIDSEEEEEEEEYENTQSLI